MRRNLVTLCFAIALTWGRIVAQGSAGTAGGAEPRFLIDAPTAGMMYQAVLALDVDFFQEGGILFGVGFGVLDRLSLGISYGGSNLIGDGEADFNPVPGFNIRVRPFEEGEVFPAIVLGFDSQGKENYVEEADQYSVLSRGFYLAASKNFLLLGYLSVHGGANYSIEPSPDDRTLDYFVGVEKTIGPMVSLVTEYTSSDGPMSTGGFMNLGIRWSVGGGFTLGFDLKDMTRSGDHVSIGNRAVKLEFLKPI